MQKFGQNNSLKMDDNIFRLILLLQQKKNPYEIIKELNRTPNTIYKYLITIHKAQMYNSDYVKYFNELFSEDMEVQIIYDKIRRISFNKTYHEQFMVPTNYEFYEELRYNLLVFYKLK